MASATQGLEFVIDGKKAELLNRELPRIKNVFKVDISFKENFPLRKEDGDMKQWIHIEGPANDCNDAKSYIISLTSPECVHHVPRMKLNPNFTDENRATIERGSQAVLTFQDGSEDLVVFGSELSVALAQSLIDDLLLTKSRKAQHTLDFDDYVIIDKDEVDSAQAMNENTTALRPVHAAHNTQRTTDSQTRQPNMIPYVSPIRPPTTTARISLTNMTPYVSPPNMTARVSPPNLTTHDSPPVPSPVSQSGQRIINSSQPNRKPDLQNALRPSIHQNGQGPKKQNENSGKPTFQSHNNQQATGLFQLAILRDYSPEDIEKCLARYDMNNIVQPAEFFKTLDEIKTSQHRLLKVPNQSAMAQSLAHSLDLNNSVIYIGAEAPKMAASPIMISDDEEDIEMDTSETVYSGPSHTRGASIFTKLDTDKSKPSQFSQRDTSRPQMDISRPQKDFLRPQMDIARPQKDIARPQKDISIPQKDISIPQKDISIPQKDISIPQKDISIPQKDISQPTASGSQTTTETTEPPEPEEVIKPKQYRKDLRYIVIDGSNVAMAHGGDRVFSVRGIEIAVQFFKARGHDRITVFVPESRRYGNPAKGVFNTEPIKNKPLLEKLNREGILKFTPARRVDGRLIASYDDRYILKLASQEDGVIVSNDQFRDLCLENPQYKKLVNLNLLQFLFVGDEFMPPDDPLGKHGVDINEFLKSPEFRGPKSKKFDMETKKPWQLPVATKARPNPIGNGPRRSREETQRLYDQLIQLFPEEAQSMSVYKVLENHSVETDLVNLTNYVMNALFS